MTDRNSITTAFLPLCLFLACMVIGPSPARAETDYGKLFYGIPLKSGLEEVQALLASRKGFKVSTSKQKADITSVRGNFDTGTVEVRLRDGKIILIQHKAGPYVLKTVRGVDTFFVKQLGPIAFLRFAKGDLYFAKPAADSCLRQCTPQCGAHAPSAYYCDKGKTCQASCLERALPKDPGALQQLLFERTPQDGGQYSSYWPCESRAKTTHIAFEAPSGCYMRLSVSDCVGQGGPPDKIGCMYDMLYRNE